MTRALSGMSREDPLRTEYRLLKVLAEGRLPITIGFTTEQHNVTHPDVGVVYTTIQKRIKRLVVNKTILGWTPVFSEIGRARLRALETIYGDGDEGE